MISHAAIETTGLTKRYPGQTQPALQDLDLTVRQGEVFGFLGPNGAGKTTTIRLLLDLIRPTRGEARILGLNVRRHSTAIRSLVGNLPGELTLWDHLTGRKTLDYLAALRPGCDPTYAYELAERLSLDLDVRTLNYSTGNKRKLGIVQAMMHRPQVLILDEPTTGLDPIMRQEFNTLLSEIRGEGRTVFLSSHVLPEVQAVCDRIGILRGGRLQTVRDMQEIRHDLRRHVTIFTHDTTTAEEWSMLPGVETVEQREGLVRVLVSGQLDAVIKHAARYTVDDVRVEVSELKDVFMEYYLDD